MSGDERVVGLGTGGNPLVSIRARLGLTATTLKSAQQAWRCGFLFLAMLSYVKGRAEPQS